MNIKYYYFIDEFNKNEIEKLSLQISLIYRNYHKKNDPKEIKKLVMPVSYTHLTLPTTPYV